MTRASDHRARSTVQLSRWLPIYLAVAAAFHGGAIAGGYVHLRQVSADDPEPIAQQPIEFIYLDGETDGPNQAERRSRLNQIAGGLADPTQPVNSGKPVDEKPQKAIASDKVDDKALAAPATVTMVPERSAPPTLRPAMEVPLAPQAVAESPKPLAQRPALPAPPAFVPVPPSVASSQPSPTAIETPVPDDTHIEGPVASAGDLPVLPPPPASPPLGVSASPLLPTPSAIPIPVHPAAPASPTADPVPSWLEPTAEGRPPSEPSPIAAIAIPISGSGLDGSSNADTTAPSPTGINTQQDEEWGDYIATVNHDIYAAWARISVDATYQPRVRFRLSRAGQLVSLQLASPSGSTAADEAALRAIALAAPFDPFPETTETETLDINLTFNYRVLDSAPAPSTTSRPIEDAGVEALPPTPPPPPPAGEASDKEVLEH